MREKIAYGLIGGIASFFLPLYILLFWMFTFVMIDMASGMLAAKSRGEILSSSKMKKTISKLMWYSSVIILVHGLDMQVLPFINMCAAQIVTGIICFVELFSNLENLYSITGNRVFYLLTQWSNKRLQETAGVSVEDEKK